MNILHMKYAVEVAKAGSINKASEILLIAQPNLSRSIKELEASLGITIFDRSAKGMFLTNDGEEFISYAKKILGQIEEVESIYKIGHPVKQCLSVSVPRSSYISNAFVNFSNNLSCDPAEIFYDETDSASTISNVLSSEHKLGIIRYDKSLDNYFRSMFEENGLSYEIITDLKYVLAFSKNSPLAKKKEILLSDLKDYIEITHTDVYIPALQISARQEKHNSDPSRKIYVYERAGQFDIISENMNTFMWCSPITTKQLQRYNIVQRDCKEIKRVYYDVLIYRKGYVLTELDRKFIEEINKSKNHYIKNRNEI